MRGKLETNNWPTPIPTKLTCNVHAIKRHGVLLDPAHELSANTAAGLDILGILVLTGCRTAEEASHPTPQLRGPIRSHGCKAVAAAPALRSRGLSVHIGQEVEDLNPDEWQIHGIACHALQLCRAAVLEAGLHSELLAVEWVEDVEAHCDEVFQRHQRP